MEDFYDVIIIGSGPAGLFCANEIIKNSKLRIAIIEKNSYSSGGLRNDGKLNLTHKIGMDLDELKISPEEARGYIKSIDDLFVNFGADGELYGTNQSNVERLVRRAERCGLELIPCEQRHIGTDRAKAVIDNFVEYLKSKKVTFLLNAYAIDVESGENFTVYTNNAELNSRFLFAAPGRKGNYWLRKQASKLGIGYLSGPIDVGVRLELHEDIYQDITKEIYDPKLRFVRLNGDIVRTFCTNPKGSVVIEPLDDELNECGNLRIINGHAYRDKKTDKTNFAILVTRDLKDPYEDTTDYAMELIKRVLKHGGGHPIIQRMGDFLNFHRSKIDTFQKYILRPSLNLSMTWPADIRVSYYAREIDGISAMIDKLDQFIPGIKSPENMLYIPEVKLYATKYKTTKNLETNLNNFYVGGDGAGKSRGIVGAAISGMLAAQGILKNS